MFCQEKLKGQVTLKYMYFLLPVVSFISLDSFGVSCLVLERFLPFVKYKGSKLCSKCDVYRGTKIHVEKLNSKVSQDNPLTL